MSTREDKIRYLNALKQRRIRDMRERHAARGGLYHFVCDFWEILEPNTPLVVGWPLWAICAHLEAVTRGEINRLLINVPPGSMKSMLLNVFWPAWEWTAAEKPGMRYISFSYAAYLTERDNQRMLDLITDPRFAAVWPLELTERGKTKIGNTGKGWKFASSVGGVGTGERANRLLCFPYEVLVQTECGPMQIGDIVTTRARIRVWSRNVKTGLLELKPVTGWRHNPESPILRLQLSDGGSIRCTPDHRIWTARPASGGMIIPASNETSFSVSKMLPRFSRTDGGNCANVNTVFGSNVFTKFFNRSIVNFASKFISKMCSAITKTSVLFAIGNILLSSSILKITEAWVSSIVVFMSNLLTVRTRTDKSQHDKLMRKTIDSFPINSHCDSRVSVIENPCENFTRNSESMTSTFNYSWNTADSSQIGDFVIPFKSRNGEPTFITGVDTDGHVMETFCLTVEDNHNMFVGSGQESYLVSNCDDPHNVKEGESDTIRTETVRWFNEAMRNRLNNVVTDAIIVIMQRVHDDDVSGSILSQENPGFPYVHLCIPMEFVPDQRCTTKIGWADPRVEAGECFWPERFPPEAVAECKSMGAFAWASQYQQTPEARTGGLLPRERWRPWTAAKFPRIDFVVVSVDPAFTAKDVNDPSGITTWGSFRTPGGDRGAMLLNARREWLELHGPDIDRQADETWDDFRARTGHQWGLVEHIADECKRWRADVLLIESKASGHSVAQELGRLYRDEPWQVQLIDPAGLDKVARVIRVQGEFAGNLVYAPDRPWSKMVIDEAAVFPRGKYDDLVDSTSQALWWMKQSKFLQRRSEYVRDEAIILKNATYKDERPLYPI